MVDSAGNTAGRMNEGQLQGWAVAKINRFSSPLRAFHVAQPKAAIGRHHPALFSRLLGELNTWELKHIRIRTDIEYG